MTPGIQEFKTKLTVVDGPSRQNLEHSLFVHPERVKVQFIDASGKAYIAVVNGGTMEDGSGDSWIISGYLYSKDEFDALGPNALRRINSRQYEGYFNTATRKGTLCVVL